MVMAFFEMKGGDFIKMRCINRKTKLSYMQEVQRRFNIDRALQGIESSYIDKSRDAVQAFIKETLEIQWTDISQ